MAGIVIFIGTRPEILKMAPFLKEMDRQRVGYKLVYTGQHYDYNMFRVFTKEFGIRAPDRHLDVGKAGGAEALFSEGFYKATQALKKYRPALCIVNGDTNSTLFSALAAAKLGIPLCHIEAGCRSFDYTMPEEVNRILVDRVSSLLFASAPHCYENLVSEGIPAEKIFMLGNTAVDTFEMMKKRAEKLHRCRGYGLVKGEYVLATLHRPDNVDNKKNLSELLSALRELGRGVILPLHPRTRKSISAFGLEGLLAPRGALNGIKVCEPLGYADFLSLLLDCKYVITDSGGVMEEAVMAGKRVIIPRINVEWYEIIEKGAGTLTPPLKKEILKRARAIERAKGRVPVVYPEKNVCRKIVGEIKEKSKKGFPLSRDFFREGRPVLALNMGKRQILYGKDKIITSKKKNISNYTGYLSVPLQFQRERS